MNVTPTSNTPQITAKEKKRVRQITSINVINIVKFELLLNPLVTTIFYFIYKIPSLYSPLLPSVVQDPKGPLVKSQWDDPVGSLF